MNALSNVNFDLGRYGIEFVASPRHADGILITGPISANMAYALRETYRAIPEPRVVILAGAEAISGGVFAGSPALDRSFLDEIPVDLYIPGWPPHPLTVLNALYDLSGTAEAAAFRAVSLRSGSFLRRSHVPVASFRPGRNNPAIV